MFLGPGPIAARPGAFWDRMRRLMPKWWNLVDTLS